MLAVELNSADLAKAVLGAMMSRHILINRTSETVLRFLPPFILRREHVDEGVAALDEILTEQTAQAASSILGGKKIGQ
jgi:acetylornithine aminotransferase/acetylornithine/N-succinyldiaminopimelate aminotransferase